MTLTGLSQDVARETRESLVFLREYAFGSCFGLGNCYKLAPLFTGDSVKERSC
jgi:hypothetical protein